MKSRIASVAKMMAVVLFLATTADAKTLKEVLASTDFHWAAYPSDSFDLYVEQGSYAEREIERISNPSSGPGSTSANCWDNASRAAGRCFWSTRANASD